MRTEISRAANFLNEGDRVTLGRALGRTPQAKNDHFSMNAIAGNSDQTFILDVLANDGGGSAKTLWSIDDGISFEPSALLAGDGVGTAESSVLGAHISVTADGKVAYSYTPELRAKIVSLPADKTLIDTFTYAIRLGNGVPSWATATVEIAGINDPPVLSGTLIHFADGEVNASYMILESDLLIGFSDPEGDVLSVANLVATNGVLKEMQGGWLFTPDTDFTGTVKLQYNVIDSHGGSVPVNQSFMIIDTPDTIAPQLVSSIPWHSGTLKTDQNIVLDFDESIVAGSGNIMISNGVDTRAIDINDTSQVTFTSGKKGGSVIIDPTDDLIVDTQYIIKMSSGVILDAAGNTYQGISDSDALDFMTIVSDPRLNWSNPWDEGTLKADSSIELYFDEPVVAGNGAIIVSNGSDTHTIDIQDTKQVTFDGAGGVIIDLIDDLNSDIHYSIQITAGAVLDTDGHAYAGINDAETLDFITTVPEPLLLWSNPWDDGTLKVDNNIELYFDETVVVGSGAIIIDDGTDIRTIDIGDTSQVTFDGYGGVIINPIDDLIPDTLYSIQITAGAVLDADGRAFAGIGDPDTLHFTTIHTRPLLAFSSPADDAVDVWVGSDIYLYFDEMVTVGGGHITISNGTDIRTIDVQDSSQVMFDGYNSMFINPAADLVPDTDYFIQMDSGVVTDMTGNPYAGIHDTATLNFSTTDSPAATMIFPPLLEPMLF